MTTDPSFISLLSSHEGSAEVRRENPGFITFLGTGNGDPLQLTLAGLKVLREADDIVLNPEVSESYAFAPEFKIPETTRVWRIDSVVDCELAARVVNEGRKIVWVFLGDPLVDGKALPYVKELNRLGCTCDFVFGLSRAALAAATIGVSMGTPIQAYHYVENVDEPEMSICLFGSTSQAKEIARHLARREIKRDRQLLMTIDYATMNQRTVETTVGKFIKAIPSDAVDLPMLLVVGPLAQRPPELDWYESKGLFGWQILLPRTKGLPGTLERRLEYHGARVLQVPTLSVEPPRNDGPVERAVRGIVDGCYQWLVFNSPFAVEAITKRLTTFGLDARSLSGIRIAAVGDQTVEALKKFGITPDLVPWDMRRSDMLAASFPAYDDLLDPLNRILITRAEVAINPLIVALTELGWEVEDVTAFRTVRAAPPPAPVRDGIKSGYFDAVVFTSATSVRNMVGIAGKPHTAMIIAAIGQATVEECEKHHLRVDVVSPEPTMLALADALCDFASKRRAQQIAAGQPVKRPSQRRARRTRTKKS